MMAKTMNDRPKNFYEPYKFNNIQGQGSYNVFSDFNENIEAHKKCKC